ncbi:ylmG homolog protein 2, chloroplastic-like [Zingiber officinale]|uniref:YGGT family protein n=1 Tax=Zingiber officinale TaxID=94328 RepID=A0A8J5HEZ7_ZINOF|nr:ylmG homolog protein 2, chloroplastic-like [Zingiber officinale]KAG6525520.1 hypothetical protein ZIOFF_015477 [Zingiber officinale]
MATLPLPSAADAPQATAVTSSRPLCSFPLLTFYFPPRIPVLDIAAPTHSLSLPPHSPLFSNVGSCLKVLATALSENPFLRNLLSLPSQLQSFYQMRCRSLRVVSLPSSYSFAAILPGDSIAGLVVANGISNFLNIYNTLLVVRLVLTWFPNSPPAIVSPLSILCDPYLNIFRGIIPPLGGTLDLSPILAFLVLNAFTSTAAALPAELPGSQQSLLPGRLPSTLTGTQEKWMKRVNSKKTKNIGNAR